MDDNISSYFESEEFQSFFSKYEEMKKEGRSIYLDADQFMDIADYYFTQMNNKPAYEAIENGLKIHPESIDLKSSMIQLLMEDEEYEQAEKIIRTLEENPEHSPILFGAQLILAQNDDAEETEKRLNTYVELYPEKNSYIDAAYVYLDYNYYEEALKWLRQAETLYPDEEDMGENSLIAECYSELGETERSIRLYNKLLDKDPYNSQAWVGLSRAYFSANNYEKALEACEFVQTINPGDLMNDVKIATCYYRLGNNEKAYKLFHDMYQSDKCTELSSFFCGLCLASAEKYEEAIPYILESLKLGGEYSSQSFEAYQYLSLCYYNTKDFKKAMKYNEMAQNEDPANQEIKVDKAKILYALGREEEAFDNFKEIIHDTSDIPIIVDIVNFCASNNEFTNAIQLFDTIKESDPVDKKRIYYLMQSFIYMLSNDHEKYEECIRKIDPVSDTDVINLLRKILLKD